MQPGPHRQQPFLLAPGPGGRRAGGLEQAVRVGGAQQLAGSRADGLLVLLDEFDPEGGERLAGGVTNGLAFVHVDVGVGTEDVLQAVAEPAAADQDHGTLPRQPGRLERIPVAAEHSGGGGDLTFPPPSDHPGGIRRAFPLLQALPAAGHVIGLGGLAIFGIHEVEASDVPALDSASTGGHGHGIDPAHVGFERDTHVFHALPSLGGRAHDPPVRHRRQWAGRVEEVAEAMQRSPSALHRQFMDVTPRARTNHNNLQIEYSFRWRYLSGTRVIDLERCSTIRKSGFEGVETMARDLYGMRHFRGIALLCVCILTLAACGGGGGGGSNSAPPPPAPDSGSPPDETPPPEEEPPPEVEPPPPGEEPSTRQYRAPGAYASISRCSPIQGDAGAPLKIVFLNINDADYFDAVVEDGAQQLASIEPFNDDRLRIAIYTMPINAEEEALGCDAHNRLHCDSTIINAAIADQCGVDDVYGVIKVGVVESDYLGAGGEIIYLGVVHNDEETALGLLHNTFIHELGHNFGMADLYFGWLYFDGSPSRGYPTELSRNFLNVDGPGCPSWCNSFKPASEYTLSSTAICSTFNSREACVTHNRDEQGDCPITDDDGNFDCCVWDDEAPFEYFGGQCAPAWGTENIGQDCLAGTGCYFGAVYGQYAWRPVRLGSESLMYSTLAASFSSVEVREFNNIIDCCLTAGDADPLCEAFRLQYSDFLYDNNFKHRIGSCGVIPSEEDPPFLQN